MKELQIKNTSTGGEIITVTVDYARRACLEPGDTVAVEQVHREGGSEGGRWVWPPIHAETFKLADFVNGMRHAATDSRRRLDDLYRKDKPVTGGISVPYNHIHQETIDDVVANACDNEAPFNVFADEGDKS